MGKLWELGEFLEEFDIVCLQETWLEEKNEEKVISKLNKRFKWWTKAAVRGNVRGRASGGQLVGIKKSASENCKVVEWTYGMIIKIVRGMEKDVWVIVVYNNVGFKRIEKDLEQCVEEGVEEGVAIVIAGDFNARIGAEQGIVESEDEVGGLGERRSQDAVVNAEGRKLLSFCERLGLAVLNGRTKGDEMGNLTFIEGGSGSSVLDLVLKLEDEEEIVEKLEVLPRVESDHLPVTFDICKGSAIVKNGSMGKKGVGGAKLLWKEENEEKFVEEFHYAWTNECEKNGEKNWDNMKKAIWVAAEKTEMNKTIKEARGEGGRGWFDKECKDQKKRVWNGLTACLNKKAERIERRAKGQRETEGERVETEKKRELGEERKKLKELCAKKRQQWFEERWRKVRESKNMVEWWEAVGKFRIRRKRTEANITKEQWVQQFSNLLGARQIGTEDKQTIMKRGEAREDEGSVDEGLDQEISQEELRKALRSTKNKKAPGEDGITAEFLKGLTLERREDLREILNQIWNNGKLPKG